MKRLCPAIFFFVWLLSCGRLFAMSRVRLPYAISSQRVTLVEGEDSTEAEVEFVFYNDSPRSVSGFSVTAFIFDDSGLSVLYSDNLVELEVTESVGPYDFFSVVWKIGELLQNEEEAYADAELYVSHISYEDGSEWSW